MVNIQIEWLVARQKLILDHFNTRDYTEPVHCSAVQCRVVGSDILLFPYFLSKLLIKLLQTVILAVKVAALSSHRQAGRHRWTFDLNYNWEMPGAEPAYSGEIATSQIRIDYQGWGQLPIQLHPQYAHCQLLF